MESTVLEPHGFEGFGVVVVLLQVDHPAVLQCRDTSKRLGERDAAGLSTHRRICKHHDSFPQVDEFHRLQVVLSAPNLVRGRNVLAVALRTAIARLDKPGLDPVAVRVVFKLEVPADENRVQIAAVVRLRPEPPASPQGRLAETRRSAGTAASSSSSVSGLSADGRPKRSRRNPLWMRAAVDS
jgi:hypothetical protein